MVSAAHLVETSVFTRLHRPAVRARLDAVPSEMLARCSMTDLELGQSARNEREWDVIHEMLAAFDEVMLSPEIVERAKRVQRMLAEQGLRGRKVPDLLIAAAAELNEMPVLHYDRHFEIIATVTGQPHEWIVPAGSVD